MQGDHMNKLREKLQGKKTYLIMLGSILYAGVAYLNGDMSANQAIAYAIQSSGIMTLRAGVSSFTKE